jgi:hypothetical protein
MAKPTRPRLPKDKPRVRRVPIEDPQARVSGSCADPAAPRRSYAAMEIAVPAPGVESTEMLREPLVRGLSIPRPAISAKQPDWTLSEAAVRSCCKTAVPFREPSTSSNYRAGSSEKSAGDGTIAVPMPMALDGTNTISRFPHTRKGLAPRQIGEGEIESHLNEARAAKGIAPGKASLIAVFRRIPVEIITHVRFEESRRLLLFRLVSCEGRRHTRIYDVAAIRDVSTGKLHLVSHRTRNRTVVLS